MSCQTTSRQNFVDVTISKHVTAEQENVFTVFTVANRIQKLRGVLDFFEVGKKYRMVTRKISH